LLSLNIGMPRTVDGPNGSVTTGIFKSPVSGRITLRKHNLDGDGQADLRYHGGEHKAVYAYPYEHYTYWRERLNRDDFIFGQFGENLTTEGLLETEVHIGDIFRIGTASIQVTQPRQPCFKLGIRMGRPEIVKEFLESERSGIYFRVVKKGELAAGDPIELVQSDPERVSVHFVNHLRFFDKTNREGIAKAIRVEALSPSWREDFESMLGEV
ncbi:MAG: MOSC domain-containing protein, partial [Candidatus Hydrogenedentes bacterium]|nr:MOSC domain-containing protein [Candidatus Hydrogenedentota bacterium]